MKKNEVETGSLAKLLFGGRRRFQCKGMEEGHFKRIIGSKSLHEASNDNRVSVENFSTSKTVIVTNTTFSHRNINKHPWTFHDDITHNQIDHILIDERRHSNMLEVRFFRGADCDNDL
jgi:hypothetical protein